MRYLIVGLLFVLTSCGGSPIDIIPERTILLGCPAEKLVNTCEKLPKVEGAFEHPEHGWVAPHEELTNYWISSQPIDTCKDELISDWESSWDICQERIEKVNDD